MIVKGGKYAYVGSYVAFRQRGTTIDTTSGLCFTPADSEDEASWRVMQVAKLALPGGEGWGSHHVHVGRIDHIKMVGPIDYESIKPWRPGGTGGQS